MAELVMVKTKPNKKIPIDKLKTTLAKLEKLASKPKEKLSLRESIYFLRDLLKTALKKGYNYQDLSELLEQQEILISPATLKQYLTESNKETAKAKRTAKTVKTSQPSQPSTTLESVVVTPETSVKESSLKPEDLPESVAELSEASVKESSETSEASLEQSDNQEQGEPDRRDETESQPKHRKTVRRKRGASSSNTDLSSEFNQY